jgi:hypothetical protein
MKRVVGLGLALGVLTLWSPAQAASSPSCAARFQAAGLDPGKLGPGQRGRLEGVDFVVAKDDVDAAKICARVDAEKARAATLLDAEKKRAETLRSQLDVTSVQLSKAQQQVDELSAGGPIKRNYLLIEGGLLAWAIIASIWASYFAGRLNPRHRHSY